MNYKLCRREFLQQTARYSAAVAMSGTIPVASYAWKKHKYNVVIKNGTIYDGTIKKPYMADIGIINDRIDTIGKINGSAAKTIDADGKIITPGFIDVHTHCDLTFKRTGYKRYFAYVMPSYKGNYNYQYQGVTTVVTGNCGYGYTDTQYWFDLADSVNFGSNICHLAPHGIKPQAYGTFPKKIRPYAMNKNVIDLQQAIRSMTSLPAETFTYPSFDKYEANLSPYAIHLSTRPDYVSSRRNPDDTHPERCGRKPKKGHPVY